MRKRSICRIRSQSHRPPGTGMPLIISSPGLNEAGQRQGPSVRARTHWGGEEAVSWRKIRTGPALRKSFLRCGLRRFLFCLFVVLSLQTTKENLEEEERVRHTPAKNNTYSSAGSDVTEALKKGKHRNKKIKMPRTTKSLPQSSGKTHEEETPKPRTRTRKQ